MTSADDDRDELQAQPASDGGSWKQIGFLGHYEYTGWVTEVTRNGIAAYRIELPDYLWGGDPAAWVEHSAASWHHTNPADEATVRRTWEAKRARDAEIAEWHARQRQALAIEPADDDDVTNPDVDPDACDAADRNDFDGDDREVCAPGDQDHDWPGPKGPF